MAISDSAAWQHQENRLAKLRAHEFTASHQATLAYTWDLEIYTLVFMLAKHLASSPPSLVQHQREGNSRRVHGQAAVPKYHRLAT